MANAHLEDKALGLELELVELVEQRQRAAVQRRRADAERLDREIVGVQEELARAAEALARAAGTAPSFHDVTRAQTAA